MDIKKICEEYRTDKESIQIIVDTFDEKEAMLISKVEDSMSFKSKVTDSRLSTIIWERAGRVMGQLPTGMVKALSMKDKGKSMLMDIILQRYIMPNANAQYSHLTKLRMWDLYSMVYGVMPMMYDYRIDDDYIGPDCWLIPVRNWIPQRGKTSIQDSDYCHVENYVSVRWLESKMKSKVGDWDKNALRYIIKKAKEGSRAQKESRDESYVEDVRQQDFEGSKGKASQVKIVTRYEAGSDGRWVMFCPDYDDKVIRDIPNPHKNGKIPIVLKYCFPLVDSIYGLGDFERGKTLQYAMDSLINLYLDGVKMSVFPPTIMNPNGIVASSVKYSPGARWLENIPNSIRPYNTNPQGLSTFQSTYQFLIGSILNQNGTTDTATNTEGSSDPGFGKTPQALQMQAARENTRDNWDRFMMEQAVEDLYDGFVNLIATKQPKPIKIDLFDEEIEQIGALHEDIQDILQISESGEYGLLTVSGKEIGDTRYKYYIDANSTLRKDDAQQSEALTNLLVAVSKIPGLNQELSKNGLKYNIGEHMKRIFATSGVEGYDKIITGMTEEEMIQEQMQTQGNPNQPPQEPGGMGGETQMASIAEPQSPEAMQTGIEQPSLAAPEGIDPDTVQAMPNAETNQFGYVPKSLQINPDIQDPDIQAIANQMFGGQ
jgi:hypothetical protein